MRQTVAKTATYLCARSDACTTGLCSCRPCSGRQSARTARAVRLRLKSGWDSLSWLGLVRPNGLRARPFSVSAILSESSPRKSIATLSEPSNFLMFLRLSRGLGRGPCRTRPGRVRAARGLNENVASRHATLLDDAFKASRGVDVFPSPAMQSVFAPGLQERQDSRPGQRVPTACRTTTID